MDDHTRRTFRLYEVCKMIWLLAIVALFLAVIYPQFRISLLIILAVLALVFGLVWKVDEERMEKKRIELAEKERLAQTRIPIDKVTIEDISVKSTSGKRGPETTDRTLPHFLTVTGRATNHSNEFAVTGLSLKLVFLDCDDDAQTASCVTVGEHDEKFDISIPPQQARDFQHSLYHMETIRPRGILKWESKILQVKAAD